MSTITLENLLGSENWREWFQELAPEEANRFLSLGEEAWEKLNSIGADDLLSWQILYELDDSQWEALQSMGLPQIGYEGSYQEAILNLISGNNYSSLFETTNWSSQPLSSLLEGVAELTETIKENYPKIAHRYYKIKSKWLKKKSLMYWDRNAPLPFQSQSIYSWKDARQIVTDAYSNFDKRAGNIVNKFFDNSWIHAPVIPGKSPGAFAASTVPSAHPFILVNYQGKARDIATLAHELGHGIHQYLAGRKQTYFNSSTPLTLAETASVFGEMLTFKSLLSITSKENERKGLLANKVEDMLNTVVRQIAFFEFEKRIHHQRKIKELSVDEICEIWIDVQKKSLGPSIKFNDDYKYFWSYIPHFIHSPFYVYAYAFGDCLVNSLFNVYESKLPKFEDKYITLLESGGSDTYDKLLKPFGLNPKKKDFWQKGVNVIENLIDQLEE